MAKSWQAEALAWWAGRRGLRPGGQAGGRLYRLPRRSRRGAHLVLKWAGGATKQDERLEGQGRWSAGWPHHREPDSPLRHPAACHQP